MARGREGIAKRERERVRQQRQEAKRLKRETADGDSRPDKPDEARLLDEYRLLSEGHAAGEVPDATYASERRRILVELGIEESQEEG